MFSLKIPAYIWNYISSFLFYLIKYSGIGNEYLSSCLRPTSSMRLQLTFRSVIHLALIFVSDIKQGMRYIFILLEYSVIHSTTLIRSYIYIYISSLDYSNAPHRSFQSIATTYMFIVPRYLLPSGITAKCHRTFHWEQICTFYIYHISL